MGTRKNKSHFLITFLILLIVISIMNSLLTEKEMKLAIHKGVSFLRDNQLENGGFEITNLFSNREWGESSYPTALVIHSIGYVEEYDDSAREIKSKGVNFLLNAAENGTFWRFNKNVPPDLDDTFLSLYALKENDIDIAENYKTTLMKYRNDKGFFLVWVNGSGVSNQTTPLISMNYIKIASIKKRIPNPNNGTPFIEDYLQRHLDDDRLFNSWVLNLIKNNNTMFLVYNRSDLNDVACEENLGALAYLSSINDRIDTYDNICGYLTENMIEKNYRCCKFCSSPAVLLYLYTRTYKDADVTCLDKGIPVIVDVLLETQNENGCWGTPLDTSLATVSLINSGYRGPALKKAIKCILDNQQADGGWESDVITLNFGSREITTGISLEALAKYLGQLNSTVIG